MSKRYEISRDTGRIEKNGVEINHKSHTEEQTDEPMLYGVEDNPPFYLLPVFGFQQAIICITGTLSIPFLIVNQICAEDLPDVRAKFLSITFFMCGVATILQDVFGVRLPIVQGGSHTFIPPIIAMMALDQWRCPAEGSIEANTTISDPAWMIRMREIQGNLMLASLTQVILGGTGAIGFLLKFIGPLTIAPTIALIGLSLTGVVIDFSQHHWGIAFLTLVLIIIFSMFLGNINVPLPAYSRSDRCHLTRYKIFQLAPVLYAIGISWLFCYILTTTDVFTPNTANYTNFARTDTHLQVIQNAPWFYFPYPFQFGMPTISGAGYVGLLAATISSIIESVGDYFAAARISGAPPVPPHAINRGIAMEGFSSIISGMVGAGHATTSYSGNIGAIAVTKVASRRVFITAGIILIICGVIGKVGAVFTLIPEPIVGGINAVLLGLVIAVGISSLQFADMSSPRNLTIFGTSIMLGMAVPQWIIANPDAIHTGSTGLDQVCTVLLGTSMFVGGVVGCILDNLVPGTLEERGISKWRENLVNKNKKGFEDNSKIYELPFITKYLRKIKCCFYVPLSPTFDKEFTCNCCVKSKEQSPNQELYVYEQDVPNETQ
ncbi:solute carrier family 23 member 2 [Patella vulgata]|uniref:solute carrier family 23 member 2 n=1 Tax=Patella vulgata TaxID=6465 RepID=UPI0021805E7A|nr:solute carrier family 23 member 2 [Patella vulgata]